MAAGDKSVVKRVGLKATDKIVRKPLMPAKREKLADHRKKAFKAQMREEESAKNVFDRGLRKSHGMSRANDPNVAHVSQNQKSSGKPL